MTELRKIEFFLLRYVPDVVKGEFVNIGVIAKEIGATGPGFVDARFTRSWRRVRCMDPQVDLDLLEGFEREIREQLEQGKGHEVLLQRLQDSFSNVLQISAPQQCFTENPTKELDTIADLYLELAKVGGQRGVGGRQEIVVAMRDAFVAAGLRGYVMEHYSIARYTRPGDPLKFLDFVYKGNKGLKAFQAVSLKAGVTDAVTLAARYPKIAPAMARDANTSVSLTAVIDDDLDRGKDEVQFALKMMEEENFAIAVAAEIPMIAEVARQELSV